MLSIIINHNNQNNNLIHKYLQHLQNIIKNKLINIELLILNCKMK